jgi:hypothetical protein
VFNSFLNKNTINKMAIHSKRSPSISRKKKKSPKRSPYKRKYPKGSPYKRKSLKGSPYKRKSPKGKKNSQRMFTPKSTVTTKSIFASKKKSPATKSIFASKKKSHPKSIFITDVNPVDENMFKKGRMTFIISPNKK